MNIFTKFFLHQLKAHLHVLQDDFQRSLLKDADEVKKRAYELFAEFQQNGPYTSEWKASGMF